MPTSTPSTYKSHPHPKVYLMQLLLKIYSHLHLLFPAQPCWLMLNNLLLWSYFLLNTPNNQTIGTFCHKTYRNALNQLNKDFEFHKKDLDTQKRIDILSQNRLAELRNKNQTKRKILSRNIERNKKLQEERIQQIQKRLNKHNIYLHNIKPNLNDFVNHMKILHIRNLQYILKEEEFILNKGKRNLTHIIRL